MPLASLPLVEQLRGYNAQIFRSDLAAGLTVGVMLIPQGMAYALLAGLPPIYGLYASLVPLLVYGVFGTSRQLAVGPVAMVSLLVAAGVGPLAGGDPERAVELALLLALMVGVLQGGMGLLRFGFLTRLLSHPVLLGFTNAAALLIGASQLRHLLGMELAGSESLPGVIRALGGADWSTLDLPTLLFGALGIGALVGLRRWRRTFPAGLAVVGVAIGAMQLGGLESLGIRVVGPVPGGLPHPGLPFNPELAQLLPELRALFPTALTIALVGFMESFAVAKVYAARHRYTLNPNRELVGLGLANVLGAFFQAFPTTGGFSRTAVNDQAGARTTVASLLSAGIVALTLLFLTPLFRGLPYAVLAAIVLVAVASLVQLREPLHLWQANRKDWLLFLFTFTATLTLGIEEGIGLGILASLLLVGAGGRGRILTLPQGEIPGLRRLRVEGPLTFLQADRTLERILGEAVLHPPPAQMVLELDAMTRLDSTGAHALLDAMLLLRERGVELRVEGVPEAYASQLSPFEPPPQNP